MQITEEVPEDRHGLFPIGIADAGTWTDDIAHSTRVGGRTHRSDRPADPAAGKRPRGESKKIRAWAIERGYELSSRGRIPAEIEQGFHDAH